MTPENTLYFELLKEWSIWLVGLQTAALGLSTFLSGKEDRVHVDRKWALRGGLCFATSIFFATWVLGAIPDIVIHFQSGRSASEQAMFSWLPIPLFLFAAMEHWFFLIGLFMFVAALFKAPQTSLTPTNADMKILHQLLEDVRKDQSGQRIAELLRGNLIEKEKPE